MIMLLGILVFLIVYAGISTTQFKHSELSKFILLSWCEISIPYSQLYNWHTKTQTVNLRSQLKEAYLYSLFTDSSLRPWRSQQSRPRSLSRSSSVWTTWWDCDMTCTSSQMVKAVIFWQSEYCRSAGSDCKAPHHLRWWAIHITASPCCSHTGRPWQTPRSRLSREPWPERWISKQTIQVGLF